MFYKVSMAQHLLPRRVAADMAPGLSLSAVLCLALPMISTAATIAPAVQAERDAERLRILQAELTREQDAVADAARRRAERLAARDMEGVRLAEQLQSRAADNVAALRREVDSATSGARSPAPTGQAAASLAAREPSGAAWWDVYARPSGRSPFVTPAQPPSRH